MTAPVRPAPRAQHAAPLRYSRSARWRRIGPGRARWETSRCPPGSDWCAHHALGVTQRHPGRSTTGAVSTPARPGPPGAARSAPTIERGRGMRPAWPHRELFGGSDRVGVAPPSAALKRHPPPGQVAGPAPMSPVPSVRCLLPGSTPGARQPPRRHWLPGRMRCAPTAERGRVAGVGQRSLGYAERPVVIACTGA